MKTLEDADIMPFGKYNGTRLEEVPAKYLLWLWNNGLKNDLKEDDDKGSVSRYIKNSMSALKEEEPDIIVD